MATMGAPRHDDKDSIVHFQQSMLYGVRLACLCCSEIGVYTAPAGSATSRKSAAVSPGA